MIVTELIYNLSVLVSLSIVSGFVDSRYGKKTFTGKLLQGVLFGVVSVIGMMHPFVLTEGIIFDGRSIVISLCTLFFGPLSGFITMLAAAVYRFILGGGGTQMGILVIAASFLTGWVFYSLREKNLIPLNKRILYTFGFLVSGEMVLFMAALPAVFQTTAFASTGLTVIGVYPFITVLIGKILSDQEQLKVSINKIHEEKTLYETTLQHIGDAVLTTDNAGLITHLNHAAEQLTGFSAAGVKLAPLNNVLKLLNEKTGIAIDNPFETILKKHHDNKNEAFLVSKQGRLIPVSDYAAPIREEDEKINGFVFVLRDQTAEREYRRNLEISNDKLLRAELASGSGNWELIIDERIIIISKGFQEIFGINENQVTLDQVLQLVLPEYRESTAAKIKDLIENGIPYSNEYKIKKPSSGEVLDIHSVASYDPKIRKVFGVIQDITFRKQAESLLRESESKYRSLIMHAPDAVLINQSNRFILANYACIKLFGATSETELLGKTPFDLFHPEDHEVVEQRIDRLINYNEVVPLNEERIRRMDGSVVYVEATASPFKLGGKTAIHVILRDITERRKAEHELRASELKYRSFFENSMDAILLTEHSGAIVSANPAACQMFMCEEIEMTKEGRDLFVDLSDPRLKLLLEERDKKGKVRGEINMRRKNGSAFPAEISSASFSNSDGSIKSSIIIRDITERKLWEKKLKEREQILTLFVEHSPAAIAMLDKEMKYIVTSKRWKFDYDLIEENLIGRSHYEVFPEIPQRWKDIHQRCLRGASEKCDRDPFPRLDGNLDWVRWEIHPWRHYEGNIGGIIVFSEVITKVVEAEQTLKITDEQLRFAMEATSDGIWDWDVVNDKIKWSPRAYTMLGYEPDEFELTIKKWEELVHPEDRENALNETLKLLNGELDGFFLEYRMKKKDGGWLWIIDRGNIVKRDELYNPMRLVGTHMDITERKIAEESIRAAEKKYREFFENDITGDYLYTIDGVLIDCNSAFIKMLGYESKEELMSVKMTALYPTDEKRDEFINKLEKDKELIGVETELVKKNGELIYCLENVYAVTNEENKIINFYGYMYDVTERKKAELKLRESEERYQSFIKHSMEGIYRLEMAEPLEITLPIETQIDHIYKYAVIAECNEALVKMYSAGSINELIGVRLEDLHGGAHSEINRREVRKFIESGYQVLGEETVEKNQAGETVWFSNNTIGIVENRKLVRMWGTQSDITEIKKAKQLIEINAEQFELLTKTSISGYLKVSIEGKLLEVNEAYCGIIGYTREELIGKHISELDVNETQTVIGEKINNIISSGYANYDVQHKCKNGEIVELQLNTSYMPKLNVLLVFLNDITERRRFEKELIAQMEEINRFNSLMVGREERMIDLKREINELLIKVGETPRYEISE